ncbi:MAG: class I SAM-dependent methyltransferase [Deltaproteobacteria bacterium]|nr:class I SAM-dependent methyltransferase [Deltaproteobacteria bacterium]
MSSDIIREQIASYQANYLEHGDTPKGVHWNNVETQTLRFDRLLAHFPVRKKRFSLHDVGSGSCDLHKHLLAQNIAHDYVGTEIVPEMVASSRCRYPAIKVFNRDLLSDPVETCDVVMLSGAFNMPGSVSSKEWEEYALRMISKMFETSRWGIAFNFLSAYRTFSAEELHYFDPKSIFDYCMKNLSRFVTLDHGYPLFEATVTVHTREFMQEQFAASAFDKYLERESVP